MDKILKDLNEAQREAVTHIDGPLLILAGAGSGKTKTITTRLAYLIKNGIPPSNTLTLTFTNKAALEMRNRALAMIEKALYPPLLCTFHKFGLLFLKFYIQRLGRKNSFVIIDTNDKKRILKNINDDLPTSTIASEISKYKNSLITPKEAIKRAQQPLYKKIAQIDQKYEEYTIENNLVDFDDLLSLTYKILSENEDIKEEISQRYQFIMVDEYQDTNELQYKILKTIAAPQNNLCVVGDDDQSIYGWRGANVKNILEFKNQFPNVKIIKLEYNYRSTNKILQAANNLIEHNRNRLGKVLKATKESGEDIKILHFQNETQEALAIAKRIKELINKGVPYGEIAVLYRVNALSRSLEEGLNKENIPYKMVGGVKFYERAEIKDLIAYLRIISNPYDDFSLKRVINKPKRGVGKVALNNLENRAFEKKKSIYEILEDKEGLKDLVSKKAYKEIIKFIDSLNYLREKMQKGSFYLLEELEREFKLREFYASMPESYEKIANIEEFMGYYQDYMKSYPENSLEDFLNEISLESDQDQVSEDNICIMSVHASKGLEFEHLFVIGMEEGFFPLIGEGTDIEEERRLGYVAITRAKKDLTLSYADSRFFRGKRSSLIKSRFLKESGLVKGSLVIEKSTPYKKGDLVKHKIFGIGRVLAVSKVKREFKLKINFGGTQREILADYVERI